MSCDGTSTVSKSWLRMTQLSPSSWQICRSRQHHQLGGDRQVGIARKDIARDRAAKDQLHELREQVTPQVHMVAHQQDDLLLAVDDDPAQEGRIGQREGPPGVVDLQRRLEGEAARLVLYRRVDPLEPLEVVLLDARDHLLEFVLAHFQLDAGHHHGVVHVAPHVARLVTVVAAEGDVARAGGA